MDELTLKLSVEEVNILIDALGTKPFIEVYKLIEKIHLQAKEQKDRNSKK